MDNSRSYLVTQFYKLVEEEGKGGGDINSRSTLTDNLQAVIARRLTVNMLSLLVY